MSAAIQWNGDNILELAVFMEPSKPVYLGQFSNADEIVGVGTPKGLMVARKGDWIHRQEDGSLAVCEEAQRAGGGHE